MGHLKETNVSKHKRRIMTETNKHSSPPSLRSCLVLSLLVVGVVGALDQVPPERPYNFLMMTPISSLSHRHLIVPLATALAERGHNVTIISCHPPPADWNPRIRFVENNLEMIKQEQANHFALRNDMITTKDKTVKALQEFPEKFYNIPEIKELYENRDQFDLFLVDNFFNEVVYPFLHGKPFITICPAGIEPIKSALIGNVLNPAYVSNTLDDLPKPFSYLDRLHNWLMTLAIPYLYKKYTTDIVQEQITKLFPELPPLLEIERNQSLVLVNSHFSHAPVVPLLPNQIDVGGIHIKPPKPLPKDILDFVSGDQSVIYFSFGSVVQSKNLPIKLRDMIVSVFARVPYKVLWQYDSNVENITSNVMIKKWMPQQDILAHPNIKLFVSHGGLLSVQEGVYHGLPFVNLPVWIDQPRNSKRLAHAGLGITLIWETLTERLFLDAINEVMANPKYRQRSQEVSRIFRDQMDTPLERAVYWTEYIVRHKGARHLQSPEKDLSWLVYLNLDVIAVLSVLTCLVFKIGAIMLKKVLVVCSEKFLSEEHRPQKIKYD